MGELEEKEGRNESALEFYASAAKYFSQQDRTLGDQHTCKLKVAELSAMLGTKEGLERAIKLFDEVSASSVDIKLLSHSVKDYLVRSITCHLLMQMLKDTSDMQPVKDQVEKYKDFHRAVDGYPPCKFLETLIKCIEDDDEETYKATVIKFKQVCSLLSSSLLCPFSSRVSHFLPLLLSVSAIDWIAGANS
jgi:hypothetical protein